MTKFIVFDGVDCAGKGTQISLLLKYLKKQGKSFWSTNEPCSFPNKLIDLHNVMFTKSEIMALMLLDRQKHIENLEHFIKTADYVICDRYYYSTYAYQCLLYGLSSIESMKQIHEYMGCPKPDIGIILTIDYDTYFDRIMERGEVDEIEKDLTNQQKFWKLKDAYNKLDDYFPELVYIDGVGDVNKIHKKILKAIGV